MKGSDYGMRYVQKAMGLSKKRAKVLDIGCGSTGRTIDEALKRGFEITGIDVSAEMIRLAKKGIPTFCSSMVTLWSGAPPSTLI